MTDQRRASGVFHICIPLNRLLRPSNAPGKRKSRQKRHEIFDQIAASIGIFVALQVRKTYITHNR
ncbi:hypothetical protein [Roseobacter sp.]|uniref:hypothetical protein n=1 Tax=Roseobacter sp. TaxID=1907202 RepID=UPI00260A74F3|nr:hypothetical protein [Roseobacter sp.]MDW3181041.1 hypothetical protein [Roseobacter sp.]